jgi:glycosyltransferase involved in cell wall biosynthesis
MNEASEGSWFPSSLTIFFPAYNDAASLPSLLNETFRVAGQSVRDYEVIVVNDGSWDSTADVLARFQGSNPHLRVVAHEKNRGYGGALRSGIAAATKDYVFYTDGDGQYDVGELPLLLAEAARGAPWVNGYKRRREDPWHRILIGAAYREFVRKLFGIRLRDVDCDFRLARREILQSLPLRSSGGAICVEMVWGLERLGLRAVELGVTHRRRLHGKSQFFRLAPLWKTLRELTALIRLRFSGSPLRPSG